MIDIMKASAGSGKTYNLAKTYISLLLTNADDHAYRHILAVTFTNKATAEMKGRILKELHLLGTDPSKSPYFKDFVPSFFPDGAALKAKSQRVLVNILHDYGAFSVSTIDKFFQMTLKAFSREIGMFASYQVELDKKSLIHESVDRILDSLTEDSGEFVEWLDDGVKEQLRQGMHVNVEKGLYEVAERLKSEEQRDMAEKHGIVWSEAFSKMRLEALRAECNSVIDAFGKKVVDAAQNVADALKSIGLEYSDTYKSFLGTVERYRALNPGSFIKHPGDGFIKRASDSEGWFSKANAKLYLDAARNVLQGPLDAFAGLFGKEYDLYNTAVILKEQTFDLVLAGKLYDEFSDLLKEKNVLSIDDSNTLLRKIIGGSDAPFVYERLGVRFEHFLLDEFQDTSGIQWDNFYPLLKESDSNCHENLVVGDVKQSIYRWRGSDWSLLASEIGEQFPQAGTTTLKENWRSCTNIVNFNNEFFQYAAKAVMPAAGLYDDVEQKTMSKDSQQGQVILTFCKKEEELRAVLDSVNGVHERGASYGDIAVLVRSNREGGEAADFLRMHDIPVVSNDSLNIKASLTVRRLVSLLSYVDSPQDTINSYLASSLGIKSPDKCISLMDLCESLLRDLEKYDSGLYRKETLYIQSFMDILQDWCSANGNSLVRFLKHWEELESPYLSSPEDADAVRIMTIHKSKGLEFPHVVFPFAESVTFYKWGWHWCAADACHSALPSSSGSIFPVSLSENAERSLFSESLAKEKDAQMVDNLNTFYVAFTRASKSLHVIACTPPANVQNGKPKSNFSQMLYQFASDSRILIKKLVTANSDEVYELGDPYDFDKMDRGHVTNESDFPSFFSSFPLGDRLKLNSDASDFFEEDGKTGTEASHRLNGIVLHDILSSVKYPDELESAVGEAVSDGRLSEEEGKEDLKLLRDRISSVSDRGWFPESRLSDASVFNEDTVIGFDGSEHRPDRVIVYPDRTIVVDYKFGVPENRYKYQILDYVNLYRRMGYMNVSGFLWYVYENNIVEFR